MIANSFPCTWAVPEQLGRDEVLLFRGEAPAEEAESPAFRAWLSTEERARAERFRFARDRRRYVFRRAFVRGALGALLGRAPGDLGFGATAKGAPYLDPAPALSLRFSLSHSEERLLLAVARERMLGVDLQAHDRLDELDRMAGRFLSPAEAVGFAQLSGADRPAAFFRAWSRKEAALKALGEGFFLDPRRISVGIEPHAAESWSALEDERLARFFFLDLSAPDGFSAAVCVEGTGWSVTEVKAD
jgi:4'-phosphopantetheinyl transferase